VIGNENGRYQRNASSPHRQNSGDKSPPQSNHAQLG
jgi:hypothetical protein